MNALNMLEKLGYILCCIPFLFIHTWLQCTCKYVHTFYTNVYNVTLMVDISGSLTIYISVKIPGFILYYAYYGGGEGMWWKYTQYAS